jgi:hypothetical protein
MQGEQQRAGCVCTRIGREARASRNAPGTISCAHGDQPIQPRGSLRRGDIWEEACLYQPVVKGLPATLLSKLGIITVTHLSSTLSIVIMVIPKL